LRTAGAEYCLHEIKLARGEQFQWEYRAQWRRNRSVGAVFAAKRSIARSLTSRALIALLRIGNDHSRASRNCASARLPETGPAVSQPVPGPLRVGPRGHCSHHRPLSACFNPRLSIEPATRRRRGALSASTKPAGRNRCAIARFTMGIPRKSQGKTQTGERTLKATSTPASQRSSAIWRKQHWPTPYPTPRARTGVGAARSIGADKEHRRQPGHAHRPAGVVPRRKQEHYAIGPIGRHRTSAHCRWSAATAGYPARASRSGRQTRAPPQRRSRRPSVRIERAISNAETPSPASRTRRSVRIVAPVMSFRLCQVPKRSA
jgi:hypothetical protein